MTTLNGLSAPPAAGSAARAMVRLDVRLIGRGVLILTGLTGTLTAIVVLQYASIFATPDDARGLQLLAENPAIRTLFGVPRALETAGGFTVWRTGTITAVTAAAWALAAATRLSRGEEEAGRAWLTLAGPLRLPAALLLHLLVVAAALAVLGAGVAFAMIMSGAGTAGAAVYAAGLTGVGWLFAALGALCAQLLGERRTATGLAAGLLLLGLLTRMVADGVGGLGWASWLTPFGLLDLSRPYTGNRWLPIGLLVAEAATIGVVAWRAAGRRDLGDAVLSRRVRRPPRLRLLRSPLGFATRRTMPAVVGWSVALGGYFLLIGLLAISLTDFLAQNPRFAELAAQAGFADLATVQGYAAALLRLLPIPLGLFAAVRLAGVAADEVDRRLALVLARPVARWRWAATEVVVVAASCLLLAVLVGAATWAGTTAVGASLGLGQALAGALNGLPVAALSLGAAVFALGWWPRAVMLIGATPTVGGFVLWVLTDSLRAPAWLHQLSPFAHLASVPAEPPDWAGIGVMLILSTTLAVAGILGFHRRDLRG